MSAANGNSLDSQVRQPLLDAIDAVPAWKRWLICRVFNRRKWITARAYNRVTAHMVNYGKSDMFYEIRRMGDALWAEIYDIPNNGSSYRPDMV